MQNTLGVEVLETAEDLAGKRLGHILVELAMLAQATGDRATGHVFQEAGVSISQLKTSIPPDHLHAQKSWRLFEAKILDNVRVIKIFQGLRLQLQRFDDRDLAGIVFVARGSRHLDLLDGNHLTGRSVESQVYFAVSTLADKLTTNPAENG